MNNQNQSMMLSNLMAGAQMSDGSLDTAILPQLSQAQSQQFQRKRDQKTMKKYDSQRLGE